MTDTFHIIIEQHKDGFTSYPVELDGVVSQGKTEVEALENIIDAINLHLETFGREKLLPKDEQPVRVNVSRIIISYREEK